MSLRAQDDRDVQVSFPKSVWEEVLQAVSVLPENPHRVGTFAVSVNGELLSIPRRVYHGATVIRTERQFFGSDPTNESSVMGTATTAPLAKMSTPAGSKDLRESCRQDRAKQSALEAEPLCAKQRYAWSIRGTRWIGSRPNAGGRQVQAGGKNGQQISEGMCRPIDGRR